jgi:hypothetical protein
MLELRQRPRARAPRVRMGYGVSLIDVARSVRVTTTASRYGAAGGQTRDEQRGSQRALDNNTSSHKKRDQPEIVLEPTIKHGRRGQPIGCTWRAGTTPAPPPTPFRARRGFWRGKPPVIGGTSSSMSYTVLKTSDSGLLLAVGTGHAGTAATACRPAGTTNERHAATRASPADLGLASACAQRRRPHQRPPPTWSPARWR